MNEKIVTLPGVQRPELANAAMRELLRRVIEQVESGFVVSIGLVRVSEQNYVEVSTASADGPYAHTLLAGAVHLVRYCAKRSDEAAKLDWD